MSTAMAETFDAPMTDSGDIDIAMYSGMATTDSWLSVEASMGDETLHTDSATFEYAQEDVEIEMADDDEAITEYEMADEGIAYADELQDVEVYDISQAPSPLMVEEHDETTIVSLEDMEPMHIPSDDHPPEATHSHVTDSAIMASYNYPTGDVPIHEDSANPLNVVQEVDASFKAAPLLAGADAAAESLAEGIPSSVGEGNIETVPAAVEYTASPSGDLYGQQQEVQPVLLPQPESASTGEGQVHGDPATENHSETVEDPEGTPGTGTGDPHEISEGVYIDPPPAVLLSLPPYIQYGECSLFNLPESSVPQSPSTSAKPDSGGAVHLLLHDRPTLYYEPLSAVFSALRQEYFIQTMTGFSEAELVLDAYDLQLSISEVRNMA